MRSSAMSVRLLRSIQNSRPGAHFHVTRHIKRGYASYGSDTIQNLRIDSRTTVIYQGFTGKAVCQNFIGLRELRV
jgi:hypothetical protein